MLASACPRWQALAPRDVKIAEIRRGPALRNCWGQDSVARSLHMCPVNVGRTSVGERFLATCPSDADPVRRHGLRILGSVFPAENSNPVAARWQISPGGPGVGPVATLPRDLALPVQPVGDLLAFHV